MKKIIMTMCVIATFAMTKLNSADVYVSWGQPTNTAYVNGYESWYLRTTNGIFNPTNASMILGSTVSGVATTNTMIANIGDGIFRVAVRSTSTNGTKSDFSNEASTNILNIPSAPVMVKIQSVDAKN